MAEPERCSCGQLLECTKASNAELPKDYVKPHERVVSKRPTLSRSIVRATKEQILTWQQWYKGLFK